MADKILEIDLNANIDKLIDMQMNLNKKIETTISLTDKLGKEGQKSLDEMTKSSRKLEQKIREIDDAGRILVGTFIPFGDQLNRHYDKLQKISGAWRKIEKSGGFLEFYGTYIDRMNTNLKTVQGAFEKTFGGGLEGMIEKAIVAFEGIIPVLETITTVLSSFLGPILIIVGALFTLKRMWVNNIGGMQTYFNKFVATIKQVWSRFVVKFDKLLRVLSPAFKILFSAVFTPLIRVVETLGVLLDAVLTILEPFVEVLGEIGKLFGGIFGVIGPEGKQATDIFKIFLDIIKFLADAIAFLVRIALTPLMLNLKLLGKILKFIGDLFAPITNAMKEAFDVKIVKPIMEAFQGLLDIINALVEAWNSLNNALGINAKQAPEADKAMKAQAIASGGPISTSQVVNNQSRVVNNNQSVSVHSSGAITEKSAPHIAGVISSLFGTQSKV